MLLFSEHRNIIIIMFLRLNYMGQIEVGVNNLEINWFSGKFKRSGHSPGGCVNKNLFTWLPGE